MSHSTKCERCGGTLKSNGGAGRHTAVHGVHWAAHGARHGSLLMLGAAAAAAALRLLNPEKLTCLSCGHTVRG